MQESVSAGRVIGLRPPRMEPSAADAYFIRKEKPLMFFRAMPVPRATARSGSSAMWNGMPVFSLNRLSSPLSRGAAAGQVDTVLHDIGVELGRHGFEHLHQGSVQLDERLLECIGDLVVVQRDGLRQKGEHVGTRHLEILGCLLQFGTAAPMAHLMASAVRSPMRILCCWRT